MRRENIQELQIAQNWYKKDKIETIL